MQPSKGFGMRPTRPCYVQSTGPASDHDLTVDELPRSGSLEGGSRFNKFLVIAVAMDDGTGFENRNSQIGSRAAKPMKRLAGSTTQLWLLSRQPWQTLSGPQRALNGQCATFHMPVPTPCSCVSRFAQYCSRNEFLDHRQVDCDAGLAGHPDMLWLSQKCPSCATVCRRPLFSHCSAGVFIISAS
ncbi:hypothetical protein IQ07DRAFT_586157 [Pyrenochaeta sp. DS3sAY3a]|nr:hypothetical protein IQ07DRAFT_586157 [Pyrenochaeta sp. DS3sAY3a]